MHGTELAALIVLVVTAGTTITTVARAYFRSRERQGAGGGGRLASVDERLARLENAVDAIAVEIERIAEGQRFTTKLLADRTGQPAARAEAVNGANAAGPLTAPPRRDSAY
jgi:hypothetical protein